MSERRLVLIRHAEAASALADADRQLTPRGSYDAAAVGAWLAEVGVLPDRVVVSSARRARQTWDRATEALSAVPDAVVDERLYENTPELLLEVIQDAAEDVTTLVVVGHNPSIGQLLRVLGDESGDPNARADLESGVPPGTAALFALEVPFGEVEPGRARLTAVRLPAR